MKFSRHTAALSNYKSSVNKATKSEGLIGIPNENVIISGKCTAFNYIVNACEHDINLKNG